MRKILNNKMWFMALLLVVAMTGCGGGHDNGGGPGPGPGPGPAPVNIGTAGDLSTAAGYAIFADTGIDSGSASAVITGNIGVGPGVTHTAITGFSETVDSLNDFSTSAQVLSPGKIYAKDYTGGQIGSAGTTPALVNAAALSMGAAYTDAAGRTASSAATTDVGGGTLTSLTLTSGVYEWGSNVTIPTDLTLSGSATDVWIFNVKGTLDMAASKNVILSGGALPQNIFWRVSGAVNIGASTHFKGIILGQTSITFGASSSIYGRLLAQTAVNLGDLTTVTQPAQ